MDKTRPTRLRLSRVFEPCFHSTSSNKVQQQIGHPHGKITRYYMNSRSQRNSLESYMKLFYEQNRVCTRKDKHPMRITQMEQEKVRINKGDWYK